MKPKPKVVKRDGQWVIMKPTYGFTPSPTSVGPFASWQDAIAATASKRVGPGAASPDHDRTYTPDPLRLGRGWQPVIR